MKLQSRLEQEEEAKAALLSRIQRLTKLILVSTKSSPSSRLSHRTSIRRRHSLVEEELAYLLHRKHDLILDEENAELIVSLDESVENNSDALKEEKKTKKPGILNWLKPRRRDSISGALTSPSDKSSGARSISSPSTPPADYPTESRHSHSTLTECKSAEFSPGARQHQEINEDTFLRQESPLISINTTDQIDLLKEQQKILSEELAMHISALKRLSTDSTRDSERDLINVEITRLNEQIKFKNDQIKLMEDKIATSAVSSHHKMSEVEETRSVSELEAQLNEKSFELEVKAGDNRVLQEQLNQKVPIQSKSESDSILGFFWTDCAVCDIVFVKTSGLDLYTYAPELKSLELVETKKMPVSWYMCTHESRLVLLASGMQCKSFTGYQLSSAGVIRLPRFEMAMAKTDVNSKPVLAAEDVHIVNVYGRMYCLQVDRVAMLLHSYRFYRDAVIQQGSLPIHSSKIAVSVVDHVLLIHQVAAKVIILYDIFADSRTPVSAPLPLLIKGLPRTTSSSS